MTKNDARSLPRKELDVARATAAYLARQNNSIKEISQLLGFHRITISRWLKSEKVYGQANRPPRARGRKKGAVATLRKEEIDSLLRVLFTQSPRDIGLKEGAWSRPIIEKYILQEWSITVSRDFVPRVLRKQGFPHQSPPQLSDTEPYRNVQTGEFVTLRDLSKQRTRSKITILTIAHHALDPTLINRLRSCSSQMSDDTYTLLTASLPRGQMQFRIYPGSPTATMRSHFLQRLRSDNRIIAIFLEPFRPTSSTLSWLKKNASNFTCLAPEEETAKPQV